MRLWISILILSILSPFALGWYASSLYFQKGESIGIIGNVISVISVISPIVGGGVAALKMFLEWYNKPTKYVCGRTLLSIIRESRVYFHPMVGEHFGMAVLEAMAAGLIPVVPNEVALQSLFHKNINLIQ
jgi:glycosyltransferase involved in cell wall biosynthesis